MNKKLSIAAVCLLVFTSCSKDAEWFQDNETNKETVYLTNAENVLGVTIDPNQDWCSTVSGKVSIQADASVKKVQLLVDVLDELDESTPSWVTRNTMKMLNQTETKGRTNLTLSYDAPKENEGLYVAFITDSSIYFSTVENGTASFANAARTRAEGSEDDDVLDTGFTLPNADLFWIESSISSYSSVEFKSKGWNPDEKLYYLNNYSNLKMKANPADYSAEFKAFFKRYIFSNLPNGRAFDNSGVVDNTEVYNNGIYVVTDGKEPVILTPAYKCDQPKRFGYEVWYSDLYYYYFKDEDVENSDLDFVSYIQSLPKYKAIPFSEAFGKAEDDNVEKHGSYALLYFETEGNNAPAEKAKGSFIFPEGYKIGFMIRANTPYEDGLKQGELYGDGRLNNCINNRPNFSSSGFNVEGKENFPRVFWLSFNDRVFMSWESGTDADFNDVIIEMQGGKVIPNIPEPKLQTYTYCFEDTRNGDYDLNDVVIKAYRKNETTVEYCIVACGAYDELEILNSGISAFEGEVHSLFGVEDPKTFINTNGTNYGIVSSGDITVNEEFTFLNKGPKFSIKDLTTGEVVGLSEKGQAPHGIMIPTDFKYPREKVSITKAYLNFGKWAENKDYLSTLWYNDKPVVGTVVE